MSQYKVIKALFDIKPVDKNGRVSVEAVYNVRPVVDLTPMHNESGIWNLESGISSKELGVRNYQKKSNQKYTSSAGSLQASLMRAGKSKKITKKAPTDAASNMLVNSVGAAYSTVGPGSPPEYSLTGPLLKSSQIVDNQKPHFGNRVYGSVDGTGFAPVGSLVATQDRYYTPPTVKQLHQEKLVSQEELEKHLNSKLNTRRELRLFGIKTVVVGKTGKPFSEVQGKPRIRPIFRIRNLESGIREENQSLKFKIKNSKTDDEYQSVLAQINEKIIQNSDGVLIGEPRKIDPISLGLVTEKMPIKASPEIERWANYARSVSSLQSTRLKRAQPQIVVESKRTRFAKSGLAAIFSFQLNLKSKAFQFGRGFFKQRNIFTLGVVGLSALTFVSLGRYGVNIKSEVVKESNSAVANLEEAKKNFELFDFEMASSNFAEAYNEFSKAGDSLNFIGASITSLFAELPGLDLLDKLGASKLKSAKNLVEAGKLLAEAGKSVSEAVNTFKYLNSSKPQDSKPESLKAPLLLAHKNLLKVEALLANIDSSILPEDQQHKFKDLNISKFQDLVNSAIEYTDFLENFAGYQGVKKYLILFQNNSELRPTGGFPGTYAVLTFKGGKLVNFFVDDIYNLDGQLKENIIPPLPLQHITPVWGMRDANWFIHFPTSAQKVMEFFKKEAGYEVDGVITMSPKTITDVLKIIGSIEMPKYGLTVNGENFLSTIQAEVEYGDNREQPKSVLKDLAPKLIEKINSSNSSQWLEIFNILISGLSEKDILMYFKDLNLENFVADKEFGGFIKDTEDDYLMVTLTNIKGSKTDKVIDNFIKLDLSPITSNLQPHIKHKLIIIRQHNGGNTEYGFYNKQNPAYVRVLVPEGSKLLNISGNSTPQFKPLIKYSEQEFRVDKELSELESNVQVDENGVSTYRESGKVGFAFWLITDPGKRKTVELEYSVPLTDTSCRLTDMTCRYSIYIQKQPGLKVDNFEFSLEGQDNAYNGEFDKDLELRFKIE